MTSKIIVRKAIKEDLHDVINMIQALGALGGMSNEPKLQVEDLIRDGGYESENSYPLFHCFVAEEITEATDNLPITRKNIGSCICHRTLSTDNHKTMFMQNLYVHPTHRNMGIGGRLINEAIELSRSTGCRCLHFHSVTWNPAIALYERLGAINMTETKDWHFYSMNRDDMNKLTKEN